MKKRLAEPDLLRCLAALAVIAQHILGAYARRSITIEEMRWIALLFECTRFAVPAFLFLAGLTAGLGAKSPFRPGAYLLRRLQTVALPYALWTLLYLWDAKALTGFSPVWTALWKGSAAYHLWYVPLFLQFALISALLLWARDRLQPQKTARAEWLWTAAIAASFALLCLLDTVKHRMPQSFFAKYNYNLFPAWLFYFVLGAAFAAHYERNLALLLRFWYLPAAAAGFETWRILRSDLAWIDAYRKVNFNIVSTVQPGFALGAAAAILTLLAAAHLLCRCKPAAAAARFVSIHSYRMYLIHVMAINHINRDLVASFPDHLAGYYRLLYLLVCASSLAAAFVLDSLFRLLENHPKKP